MDIERYLQTVCSQVDKHDKGWSVIFKTDSKVGTKHDFIATIEQHFKLRTSTKDYETFLIF